MNIKYINPFIEATETTFRTMCAVDVERDGELSARKTGLTPVYNLIGTIGLSGAVRGAVLITMDTPVARKVVKKFLGESLITDNDLTDGIGELLNIISGSAAAKLGKVNLAIPTVMIGEKQKIHSLQYSPWIIIPMRFPDWGRFNIEVAMEEI
jgi:CheY-specific phosphatase CheX